MIYEYWRGLRQPCKGRLLNVYGLSKIGLKTHWSNTGSLKQPFWGVFALLMLNTIWEIPIVPIVDLDPCFKGSVFCPAPSLCVVPTGCLLSACRSHVNHSTLSILSPGLAFLSKFNKESNYSLVSPPSIVNLTVCPNNRRELKPLFWSHSAQSRSFIFFRPNLHFPLSSPCSGLDPR